MKEEKGRLFTFRNTAIHLTILALIVLVSIFPIAFSPNEARVTFIIIEGVIFGLLTIFLIVELAFLIYFETQKRKSVEFRFVKQFMGEHKFREIMFTPIATLFSTLFALSHFVVYLITDLWYFAALCIFYLLCIALKVYQVHVDEAHDNHSYFRGVRISNILTFTLSLLFVLTIFGTIYFRETLHEPLFLFILDIVFFVLKLVFAIISLIGTIREKKQLMIAHTLVSFTLTFYTGYAIIIYILHMNRQLTMTNILISGLSISITLSILTFTLLLASYKLPKK